MNEAAEEPLTPEILLRAYAIGIFPMAESADDPALHWIEPKQRGIIPLDGFHLSKRMARMLGEHPYRVVIDQDFDAVIAACAAPRAASSDTWINGQIRQLYRALFDRGFCHTVEVRRRDDDALVGGLYGVSLGGAFFGESMFHVERDCSKLALVHLVARLRYGGYTLLDTQFVTEHLKQFGAVEIPRTAYRTRLTAAQRLPADYRLFPEHASEEQVLAALHP